MPTEIVTVRTGKERGQQDPVSTDEEVVGSGCGERGQREGVGRWLTRNYDARNSNPCQPADITQGPHTSKEKPHYCGDGDKYGGACSMLGKGIKCDRKAYHGRAGGEHKDWNEGGW